MECIGFTSSGKAIAFRARRAGHAEELLQAVHVKLAFGEGSRQEPRAAFWVLLWLVPVSFLAFVLSRPKDDPDDPAVRFRRLMNNW